MANYKITRVKSDEAATNLPEDILVTSAIFNGTDAEINAALPVNTPAGTLIHTQGYAGIKEKGLDGSWATV